MAEQLEVEVDVKNVTEEYTAAGQAPLFCLDIWYLEILGDQIFFIISIWKFWMNEYYLYLILRIFG